jgi:predicted dehydrogenase
VIVLSAINKYGIGIVGCGAISLVHAQALGEAENAELVSVYSRNANRAREMGEKYDVSWYVEWNAFIYDQKLNAVSICTPSGTHLDYAELAAQTGKHVIIEKPLEVTVERGKKIIDICRKSGVQLAVIFQNRYTDKVEEMKNQLDARKLGKIHQGDAYIKWFRDQDYYDSGAWRGTLDLDGGGALINQSIHTIDLLQWMMGEVDTIYGQIGTFTHKRIEGEDTGIAAVRFKSGAVGVIEGTTSVYPAQARKIEIHGEKGSAILDGDNLDITTLDDVSETERHSEPTGAMGAASPFADFDIQSHKKQFESIFYAISNNQQPVVSGSDALKSLAIVQAIYKSSKSGEVVRVDDLIK